MTPTNSNELLTLIAAELRDSAYPLLDALAALNAMQEAGLAIVPVEPTNTMRRLGAHAYSKADCGMTDHPLAIDAAWEAMLDASPFERPAEAMR